MSSLVNQVYLNLPRFVQNLVISSYGAYQRKLRYGGVLPRPYDRLHSLHKETFEEIKQLQNDQLRRLVKYAITYVPHYIDLFRKRPFDLAEMSVDSINCFFPILEKEQVVADPDSFQAVADKRRDCIRLFTSGTSGSPMPILCTKVARRLNYAFFQHVVEMNGSRLGARSATFAGRVLFSPNESRAFWRKDWINKVLYCSSYYIGPETFHLYVEALDSWQPEYIDSYPSAIVELARHINVNHVRHTIRPKFILTSSETLTAQDRAEIENAFTCHVVDQYGCTEMAVFASSTETGYHVEPLYSIVELEKNEDQPGNSVITTGLINFAMPLIRYRIGDLIDGVSFESEWPAQSLTFSSIVGRIDDVIVTPEGRRIGRMDPAFKGIEGITRAQIVQSDTRTLRVLIERRGSSVKVDEKRLVNNIRERTSEMMCVTIDYVEKIPLAKNGKFKSVVSKVGRP